MMGTTRRTWCSRGSTSTSMWGARPRRLYKTVLRTWWRTGWTLHRQAFLQRPAFSRRLCQRTIHRPALLQRPAFIRRLCQRTLHRPAFLQRPAFIPRRFIVPFATKCWEAQHTGRTTGLASGTAKRYWQLPKDTKNAIPGWKALRALIPPETEKLSDPNGL